MQGGKRSASSRGHARVAWLPHDGAVYAVGDLHGSIDLLRKMDDVIGADPLPGPKVVVHLGDHIDRGSASAQVLDRLLAQPSSSRFLRVSVVGNHELAMLSFIENPTHDHPWLALGGLATLGSYGVPTKELASTRRRLKSVLATFIPQEHLDLLRSLPAIVRIGGVTCVHAGLRQGVALDAQSLDDVTQLRDGGDCSSEAGTLLVHGHTIYREALQQPGRIGVDTGAYATGRLSAVRISAEMRTSILSVGRGSSGVSAQGMPYVR